MVSTTAVMSPLIVLLSPVTELLPVLPSETEMRQWSPGGAHLIQKLERADRMNQKMAIRSGKTNPTIQEQDLKKGSTPKDALTVIHHGLYSVSPIHGLGFIHKSRNRFEITFWYFVMLGFVLVMARDVYNLIDQYKHQPSITKVHMKIDESFRPPPVTMCLRLYQKDFKVQNTKYVVTRQNKTKQISISLDTAVRDALRGKTKQDLLNGDWEYKDIFQTAEVYLRYLTQMENIDGTQSFNGTDFFNSTNRLLRAVRILESAILSLNITQGELYHKFGEELKRFYKLEVVQSEDEEAKSSVVLEGHKMSWIDFKAYCFLLKLPEHINSSEEFVSASVDLDTVPGKTADKKKRRVMFSFQGERKAETLDPTKISVNGGRSKEVSLDISAKYIAANGEETKCSAEEKLSDCQGRCRAKLIFSKCGGVPISWSHLTGVPEGKTCTSNEYETCLNYRGNDDADCVNNCHNTCTQTIYRTNTLASQALKKKLKTVARIRIHFYAKTYPVFEEYYPRLTQNLTSDLGGTLGLWFGASIMSIIHLAIWSVKAIYWKFKNKKNVKKGNWVQGVP